MANKIKCKDCRNYDPIRSGQTRNPQHGWCAVKSIYPFKEEVGQVFPPGVRRVESPDELAKPTIVEGNKVIPGCIQVKAK
jgi:hypothetical protein